MGPKLEGTKWMKQLSPLSSCLKKTASLKKGGLVLDLISTDIGEKVSLHYVSKFSGLFHPHLVVGCHVDDIELRYPGPCGQLVGHHAEIQPKMCPKVGMKQWGL